MSILMVSAFRFVAVHNEHHVLTERNIFYLAPLLLIGLMMWFDGSRRSRRLLVAASIAAAALPALVPLRDLGFNARFQAPSAVIWIDLKVSATLMVVLLLVFGAAMTALLLLPRRRLAFAPFTLALVFMVSAGAARSSMQLASSWTEEQGGSNRGLVDRAVGDDSRVAVVWREAEPRTPLEATTEVPLRAEHRVLYLAEFFNRSVGPVYNIGRMPPYPLPYAKARIGPGGALLTADGTPVRSEFVLAQCATVVRGAVVEVDPSTGAKLVRTGGLVRVSPTSARCGAKQARGG
jgi:hypothetical protein